MKLNNILLNALQSKSFTIIFFAIHFVVTLFFVRKNYPWQTGDSPRYLKLAANLREGVGFGLVNETGFDPEGLRDLGYPLFIAFCQTVTATETFGVIVFQSLLFFLSVWLIWKTSESLFNKLTAQFFLLVSALYPFLANSANQISPEIVTVFLVSLAVYLLLRENLGSIFLAALCISLSAYFRANLIFLCFFIAFVLLLFSIRNIKYSLVFVITSLLIAAPNMWRNYQVFGKLTPVPVYSATGHSLLVATWQSKISAESIIDYSMKGAISEEMKQAGLIEQIQIINNSAGASFETVVTTPESYKTGEMKTKASEASYRMAVANIRESPFSYLKSTLINFFRLWFSANFPDTINPVLKTLLLVQGVVVFLLGLGGIIISFYQYDKLNLALIFSAATIAYLSLTLCWLHTEARYTITGRLLLLMFASVAVSFFAKKLLNANSS
jgi:hypothetical protein